VRPVRVPLTDASETSASRIGHEVMEKGLLTAGAPVVVVSISQDLARPDANFLKIHRL
jgi:hypothetical protein